MYIMYGSELLGWKCESWSVLCFPHSIEIGLPPDSASLEVCQSNMDPLLFE